IETPIGIVRLWLSENEKPENFSVPFFMAIDDTRKLSPDWVSVEIDGENVIALEADWDGNTDIWLYYPDIQEREQLTDTDFSEQSPAWSPDGTQLAYMTWESDRAEIAIHDFTSGESRTITSFEGFASAPQWSPDGNYLVFSGNAIFEDEEDLDLYIMDSNGDNVRKITDFDGNEGFPDWRPCPTTVSQ
ncbi:MAG: hypothetical protein AAFV93_16365, partial [Chloroflexota bacterium]